MSFVLRCRFISSNKHQRGSWWYLLYCWIWRNVKLNSEIFHHTNINLFFSCTLLLHDSSTVHGCGLGMCSNASSSYYVRGHLAADIADATVIFMNFAWKRGACLMLLSHPFNLYSRTPSHNIMQEYYNSISLRSRIHQTQCNRLHHRDDSPLPVYYSTPGYN